MITVKGKVADAESKESLFRGNYFDCWYNERSGDG